MGALRFFNIYSAANIQKKKLKGDPLETLKKPKKNENFQVL